MPSAAAVTAYAFGVTAFAAGAHELLLNADDGPNKGNALAAIAMGLYYTLAGWQENRTFFALSVPMRTLSAIIFLRIGGDKWRTAGLWEGAGAACTAIALLVARRR
ncbi:hypothetical protein AURDEDRAFT_157945 [Auricularia subglabra TFB-10046 SS5]|nr:hypothetical protein AURDEDRAFT_157945 [Auricularia subglabra TFB-10046 SS5]